MASFSHGFFTKKLFGAIKFKYFETTRRSSTEYSVSAADMQDSAWGLDLEWLSCTPKI